MSKPRRAARADRRHAARGERPASPRAPRPLLAAGMVAALALVVYANSLGNELVYDDLGVVAANRAVRDPGDLRAIFLAPSWFAVPSKEHRPVTTWTFALDYAAHGLRPLGYHVVNALLHAGVSALVVVLVLRLGGPLLAAAIGGALFAVHPIHTEAVAYVVGRAELLAAGFMLLGLLVERSVDGARRPFLPVAATAIAYGLGLASKEHVVALLALVPLADLLFDDDGAPRRFVDRLRGRRLALYLSLAGVTLAYLVLRRVALGDLIGAGGLVPTSFWQNPAAGLPWGQRVPTAGSVAARAVWLLFLPLRLSADYSYRQIPVVTSWLAPGALAGFLAGALVLATIVRAWRTRRWQALFYLLLAVLTYLPVSNVPLAIGTIFAERLLYLPSVGFCALLGLGLARLARRSAGVAAAATGVVVVAWSGMTVARNAAWHDELTLARATVASAPESTQAHRLLAYAYAQHGRTADAMEEYRRAVELYPDNAAALEDMAALLKQQGRSADALPLLRRAVALEPGRAVVWVRLGTAENGEGHFDEALAAADRALALQPDSPDALAVRGFALRGLERRPDARAAFERALARAPAQVDALTGLAALAIDDGDYDAAAQTFERLVRVAPSRDGYAGLVQSYQRAGRADAAARALAAARQRFPDDPRFR